MSMGSNIPVKKRFRIGEVGATAEAEDHVSCEMLHNRLHLKRFVRACAAKVSRSYSMAALLVAIVLVAGCDTAGGPLADYEGDRPLIMRRVTQSSTADIQWLGGRVAAVGVNRGENAGLDSTLVWIRRADVDSISSHATVGEGGDADFVRTVGGEPISALEDGETYTVWLATTDALEAGLDSTLVNEHSFVDTTVTMRLLLRGRSGGDPTFGFDASISLDERLTGTSYVLSWEPTDLRFRQVAIRNSSTGGFTDLVWHAVIPDDQEASISSPVVLGEAPEGAQEAVSFTGFEPSTYTLWMVTDDWTQQFGPRATGYAFFTILSSNFEQEAAAGGN